jgi:hypothetical protein
MTRFFVVEGQTEPIDVQLFRNHAALDLSGLAAPTLVLRGKDGVVVDTTGGVSVLDAPTGKLRFNPASTAFTSALSPYVGRWRVVDAAGKIGFWPNQELDHWIVGA